VLEAMTKDTTVRDRANAPGRLRLLWDVAQVPDFRKVKPEFHARLMAQVYTHLTQNAGVMPDDWVASHVDRLNRTDGDIHVLMDRIAGIRTWTYLSHRGDWMTDAREWQDRTREVEDRLSDALHDKLTKQFVDSRTAHLVKRLRGDDLMAADVAGDGIVTVDGHRLGHLEGLRFRAERTGTRTADRAVLGAANAALRPLIAARIDAIVTAGDEALSLDDEARIIWQNEPIAMLVGGGDLVHPDIEVPSDERIESTDRLRLETRLRSWLTGLIDRLLEPLAQARQDAAPPAVRGILFHLAETLGLVPRNVVEHQLKALTPEHRKILARAGVRFGIEHVYMPALLKAAPARLRALLWIAAHRQNPAPRLPAPGRVSVPLDVGVPHDFYRACGYQPLGAAAYRIDMLERFAATARKLAREKVTVLPPETLSLLGINAAAGADVLRALGFKAKIEETGLVFRLKRRGSQHQPYHKNKPNVPAVNADSPFAKLKQLMSS
jgi:ATP-dependent RNA helicase SUPV3L1/SUV3